MLLQEAVIATRSFRNQRMAADFEYHKQMSLDDCSFLRFDITLLIFILNYFVFTIFT
jgi:hypothetical protein